MHALVHVHRSFTSSKTRGKKGKGSKAKSANDYFKDMLELKYSQKFMKALSKSRRRLIRKNRQLSGDSDGNGTVAPAAAGESADEGIGDSTASTAVCSPYMTVNVSSSSPQLPSSNAGSHFGELQLSDQEQDGALATSPGKKRPKSAMQAVIDGDHVNVDDVDEDEDEDEDVAAVEGGIKGSRDYGDGDGADDGTGDGAGVDGDAGLVGDGSRDDGGSDAELNASTNIDVDADFGMDYNKAMRMECASVPALTAVRRVQSHRYGTFRMPDSFHAKMRGWVIGCMCMYA